MNTQGHDHIKGENKTRTRPDAELGETVNLARHEPIQELRNLSQRTTLRDVRERENEDFCFKANVVIHGLRYARECRRAAFPEEYP